MPTPPFNDPESILNPTVGGPLSAAWCDTVRDGLLAVARPPGCVVRAPAQSVGHNEVHDLAFTSPDWRDTDGFHDTESSPEKIVIPAGLGGWYQVTGSIEFAANATGRRQWVLFQNDASTWWQHRSPAVTDGAVTSILVTAEIELAAGDELKLGVSQTSGGPLNASALVAVRLVAWA